MNNKLLCRRGLEVLDNSSWKRSAIRLDEHLWKVYETRQYSWAYFPTRRPEFNSHDFQADDSNRHEQRVVCFYRARYSVLGTWDSKSSKLDLA